ncbi:EamA family transporter [Streptacidiphilus sp. ASG 303]|uniref:EamA family transporter n=1 Tax=Streptacidiphilus sp. ASG 303 TaxID=2896847 RepID=UPI001E608E6D|nr:EamA family transporter [Streptacidiphilus sp. ASG 303]MCD0483412.1 EamA family transporter [Streptacidiphilus sp. ASG 303]
MTPAHIGLAVAVAAVWGLNFVLIDVGLHDFPPLLFCALRFTAVALPGVLFAGPPRVPWRWVLAVGFVLGVVKFGLLFVGMHAGMPAGLSSLVLQSQAVFTAVFAAVLLRERPGRLRLAGMALALLGIALVAADRGAGGPAGSFALVVAAAAAWGLSNVLTRRAAPPDMLRWMVWVSAVPPLPLLALSLLFEGPRADLEALRTITPAGLGAVAYVAWAATLFGFGAWGYLLRAYDASAVAPYSLLVPVFGMSSAWLLLGERISPAAACAAVLVVGGVGLTALRPRRRTGPAPAPGTAPDHRPAPGPGPAPVPARAAGAPSAPRTTPPSGAGRAAAPPGPRR